MCQSLGVPFHHKVRPSPSKTLEELTESFTIDVFTRHRPFNRAESTNFCFRPFNKKLSAFGITPIHHIDSIQKISSSNYGGQVYVFPVKALFHRQHCLAPWLRLFCDWVFPDFPFCQRPHSPVTPRGSSWQYIAGHSKDLAGSADMNKTYWRIGMIKVKYYWS